MEKIISAHIVAGKLKEEIRNIFGGKKIK